MPVCPMLLYSGITRLIRRSMVLVSTPTMLGKPWPIWSITWWVMWQCMAQSPGSWGTNSITRVLPTVRLKFVRKE
jgi:hypothetical protein